jgi:hypothetical protein
MCLADKVDKAKQKKMKIVHTIICLFLLIALLECKEFFLRRNVRSSSGLADLGGGVKEGLYFVQLSVGTPSQNFQVMIDTGTS